MKFSYDCMDYVLTAIENKSVTYIQLLESQNIRDLEEAIKYLLEVDAIAITSPLAWRRRCEVEDLEHLFPTKLINVSRGEYYLEYKTIVSALVAGWFPDDDNADVYNLYELAQNYLEELS